jgi:UDP-3-O-[3-hydroxymyristoyl] glucosamine N-acyltransferase
LTFKSFSVQDILNITQGRLINGEVLGDRALSIRIEKPSTLGEAKPSDIAFFFSPEFKNEILTSNPGILVLGEAFVDPLQATGLPFLKTSALIASSDPYLAMAQVSEALAAGLSTVAHPIESRSHGNPEIHPTAVVHPTAKLAQGVQVGAATVIEANVEIGAGTIIYPQCYIGPGSKIGCDGVLFPRVTLYEWTQIGDRVRLHAGVVLGADGFGYAPHGQKHQKIFHLGKVVLGDDVEIGANSMIDRGTFGNSKIGNNVKIDNHCHLGHNTEVGDGSILCGGACMAGGARLGKFVYVGGLTGIGNRVHVGDFSKIGGLSAVDKDVAPHGLMVGSPIRDKRSHFRIQALLNKMLKDHEKKS